MLFQVVPELPDPGTMALLGAAAFMSASGSVVLFVIAMLVEITGQVRLIFPVAVVSYSTIQRRSPGVHDNRYFASQLLLCPVAIKKRWRRPWGKTALYPRPVSTVQRDPRKSSTRRVARWKA